MDHNTAAAVYSVIDKVSGAESNIMRGKEEVRSRKHALRAPCMKSPHLALALTCSFRAQIRQDIVSVIQRLDGLSQQLNQTVTQHDLVKVLCAFLQAGSSAISQASATAMAAVQAEFLGPRNNATVPPTVTPTGQQQPPPELELDRDVDDLREFCKTMTDLQSARELYDAWKTKKWRGKSWEDMESSFTLRNGGADELQTAYNAWRSTTKGRQNFSNRRLVLMKFESQEPEEVQATMRESGCPSLAAYNKLLKNSASPAPAP